MGLFGVEEGIKIIDNDGEAAIVFGSEDPSVAGRAAPEGSLYLRTNGVSFKKVGPLDTDWESASQTEGAGIGYVFVTDVTNAGNIGQEAYIADTIPANTVLTECTTDTTPVTIEFLAEPAGFYSPTLSISGVDCSNLTQYGDDRRLFSGSFDVTLACAAGAFQDFVIESSTGQNTTVRVNLAGAGPEIQSIIFGAYPGIQTALKHTDQIGVTVKVPNDADSVWIEADKASKNLINLTMGALDGAGVGYRNATGIVTISTIGSDSPVDAQAENALGTRGAVFTSANLTIDQVYPNITFNSITYPGVQGALKNSETADVDVSITNWVGGTDNITYSTPLNQITIPSTSAYTQIKTVTRIAGDYNISTNNYSVSANKVSNDSTSSASYTVKIANVAAQLTISEPASRLRTRGTGFTNVGLTTAATSAEHTITIGSNQTLASVPTLADPSAGTGTWKNGAFSGATTSFTNVLVLPDSSTRGTHNWGAISGTNLSGLTTTAITGSSDYVIGGYYGRYYELVLGQNTVIGATETTTYSKFTLAWSFIDGSGSVKTLSRAAVVNTAPPVTGQYTIDAVDGNPTTYIIIDTAATQSMTQNTAIYVAEAV